ncbi:MAG: QueT transporter family protein [Planctomycetota bacterium]
MKIKTEDVALISIFAALYAAITIILAPISFLDLQFRVSGILRPAIAKKWVLSIGYGIGVVVANLVSPFAGPHELVFMPIASLIAGLAGFIVAKRFNGNYFVAGAVIATIIPIAVYWMLNQLFGLPFIPTFPYLLISEQIICLAGAFVFRLIDTRYKWWN